MTLNWAIDQKYGRLSFGKLLPVTGNTYELNVSGRAEGAAYTFYVMDESGKVCLAKSEHDEESGVYTIAFNLAALRDQFVREWHEIKQFHTVVSDGENTIAEGDLTIVWNPVWTEPSAGEAFSMRGPRGYRITDVEAAEVIDGDQTTTTKIRFWSDAPDDTGEAPSIVAELPVVARNGHTATIHMQKFAGRDNKITDPTNPNLSLAFLCMSVHFQAKNVYPETNFAFIADAEYNNAIYQSKLVDIPTDQHWVFGATGLVIATHPNYKDVETSAGVFETILDENHYWEFRALEYYKEGDTLPTPSDDQILVKAETGSATGGYLLVGAGLVDTPRGPQGRSMIDVDVSCVEVMPCSTITHVDVFVDKPECGDGKRCKLTSFCVYARNGENGTDGDPGRPGEKGCRGEKGCKGCKGCAGEGEGWRIHSDCSCVTTGSSGVRIYYGNSANGGVSIYAEKGGAEIRGTEVRICGSSQTVICSPAAVYINGGPSRIVVGSSEIKFCNPYCDFIFNCRNLKCFARNYGSICGCNGFVDTNHNCGVVIYAGCYGEDDLRDVKIYAVKNVGITADMNLSFCSRGNCGGKIYFNGREFQPGKIFGPNGEVSVDVGSSGVMIFAKCAGWVDIGNTCNDTNIHGRAVVVEGGVWGVTLCAGGHTIGVGSSGVMIDGGNYIPAHKPLADDFKIGCNYPKGSFVYYGRDYYQAMVDIQAGSSWPSVSSDWSKRNLLSLFSNDNGKGNSWIDGRIAPFTHYDIADANVGEDGVELADRTFNRVAVSAPTTFVLPDAVSGKARDLAIYIKASVASATLSFAAANNTFLGDAMPVTAVGGKYLVLLTEIDTESGKTVWNRSVKDITPAA